MQNITKGLFRHHELNSTNMKWYELPADVLTLGSDFIHLPLRLDVWFGAQERTISIEPDVWMPAFAAAEFVAEAADAFAHRPPAVKWNEMKWNEMKWNEHRWHKANGLFQGFQLQRLEPGNTDHVSEMYPALETQGRRGRRNIQQW